MIVYCGDFSKPQLRVDQLAPCLFPPQHGPILMIMMCMKQFNKPNCVTLFPSNFRSIPKTEIRRDKYINLTRNIKGKL